MNVEIKERKLPTGKRSLYLEYYETGFRKKESLGLILVSEDSPKAKLANKETLKKAQELRHNAFYAQQKLTFKMIKNVRKLM